MSDARVTVNVAADTCQKYTACSSLVLQRSFEVDSFLYCASENLKTVQDATRHMMSLNNFAANVKGYFERGLGVNKNVSFIW